MSQGDTGPIGTTFDQPTERAEPRERTPGQRYQDLGEEARMLREQFPAQRAARKAAGPSPAVTERVKAVREKYEPMLSQPYESFQPSKETATNLASLGGLLMVMGTMSGGKGLMGATGAMNAMAGMLKGYQEGRKELYEKERKAFETNFKVVQQNRTILKQEFERALKEAQTDLQGATTRLSRRLKAAGAGALAAEVDKSGISRAKVAVDQAGQNFDTQIKTYQQAQQRLSQIAAEQRQMKLQAKEQRAATSIDRAAGVTPQRAAARERSVPVVDPNDPTKSILVPESETIRAHRAGTPYTPAPRSGSSGPGGVIQFRYNNAVANATEVGATELENLALSPLGARPPIADDILTHPSKSLTDAAKSFFAQKITPAEDRAVQQSLAGLTRAVANIQAGGRPGGVTESSLKELSKMAPRAGDSKINTYLYLAMMRQEFNIAVKDLKAAGATKEQIGLAEANKARVEELIPWTVKDVTRILREGGPALVSQKTVDLIRTSESRKQFEKGVTARERQEPIERRDELSDVDQQALDWANSNPNDPRSRAIKQRLGVQ